MHQSTPNLVESLTLRIAQLEITVSVRSVDENSGTGHQQPRIEIVSPTPAGPAAASTSFTEAEGGLFPFSAELEAAAFAAQTPTDFLALELPFLDYLIPKLRGVDPTWTPRARIARAFHCGVVAGRRLGGEIIQGTFPGLPFRNTFYVCLRGPGNTAGFWTSDYGKYIARLGSGSNSFHPDSISQAFPSQAEGEAYLIGARVQWPAEAR